MNDPNLWLICLIAFTMVMALLGSLALVMAGITRLFPIRESHRPAGVDPMIVAAIQSVAATQLGAVVTRIEERK